ncbi:fibronectin type III domain-containing protein [Lachnospiraceae bacterium]|nr:fibronectin type III domain-containing protein [Lachnospiraceae bacterium]
MGKIWKFVKFCTMAVVCVLFLGAGMKSEAVTIGTAGGLKQISAGPNRVEVSWDAVIGNQIRYKAELCENKNFTGGIMDNLGAEKKGTDLPRETFSGLTPGKKYYVRVTAFSCTDEQFNWGTPSAVLEVVTAPEDVRIQNFKQTKATETSITVSWKKCAEANAYQLIYGKKGDDINSRTKILLDKVTSYTAKKLSKNAEYNFWICPVKKSAAGYCALSSYTTNLLNCPVLPVKVKGVEASFWSPTSEHLDLEWKPSDSADGYQYQIYAEGGKKALLGGRKTENGSSTNFSTDKLKSLRFLKLRVRAFINITGNSQYGKWSDWVYFARQPDVETQNTKGGVKLTWDKVRGAHNYTIYVSTRRESGYKKVENTTKTSATVKKCGKSNLKSGKQYYFMVVANKRVGKKTFQSTRNYCFWITYRK